MIIILEGPDGSGKSTLAEKLHQQTGYKLIHRDKPKTEEDKARMMDEYIQIIKAGKNVILDRAWYSEMVYGPIMRDENIITYPKMYELECLLTAHGAIIIYCTAPTTTLWKRCLSRGEDYVTDVNTFKRICAEYDSLMHNIPHIVPVVTYEYNNM